MHLTILLVLLILMTFMASYKKQEHKKQLKLANQERILSKERDRLNRELQMIKATGREDDPLQDLERKLEDARDVSDSSYCTPWFDTWHLPRHGVSWRQLHWALYRAQVVELDTRHL